MIMEKVIVMSTITQITGGGEGEIGLRRAENRM